MNKYIMKFGMDAPLYQKYLIYNPFSFVFNFISLDYFSTHESARQWYCNVGTDLIVFECLLSTLPQIAFMFL